MLIRSAPSPVYGAASLDSTVETTESARLRGLAADFAAVAGGPDGDVDLGRCALLVGRIPDPDLDVETQLARLDDLAAASPGRSPNPLAPVDHAEGLCRHLFDELGFRGNRSDYNDPENSYLHRVLDRRLGLPITLSILLIEVAGRQGLTIEGVGTPQHFLVRVAERESGGQESEYRYIDPFNGGERVDREQLVANLRQALAGSERSPESFLTAVTKRQILTRTLNNLKVAAARRGQLAAALGAAEFLVALQPWAIEEIRDRGLLAARLALAQDALLDLRTYREQAPHAADSPRVEAVIRNLERGAGPEATGEFGV